MRFPRATRHCKDDRRRGRYGPNRFDFLGYTFRTRSVKSRAGRLFVGFTPAVSDDAGKRMRWRIRRWRLHLRTTWTLDDLARMVNPVTRGWIHYYGRYRRSQLYPTLRRIDEYLVRWLMHKYKRFKGCSGRAYAFLVGIKERQPALFAHWQVAALTAG